MESSSNNPDPLQAEVNVYAEQLRDTYRALTNLRRELIAARRTLEERTAEVERLSRVLEAEHRSHAWQDQGQQQVKAANSELEAMRAKLSEVHSQQEQVEQLLSGYQQQARAYAQDLNLLTRSTRRLYKTLSSAPAMLVLLAAVVFLLAWWLRGVLEPAISQPGFPGAIIGSSQPVVGQSAGGGAAAGGSLLAGDSAPGSSSAKAGVAELTRLCECATAVAVAPTPTIKPSPTQEPTASPPAPTPTRPASVPATADKPRVPAGVGPTGDVDVEIILDLSGSMNQLAEPSKSKLAVAKNVITKLIAGMPARINAGLRVFGHRVDEGQQVQSCQDIELLHPVGPLNRAALTETVQSLQAKGWTPIARSLERARLDFPANSRGAAIILVSDGVESCGGNPVAVAAAMNNQQPPISVHTIGLGVHQLGRARLSEIAKAGGGQFVDVGSEQELDQAVHALLDIIANRVPSS